MSDGAVIDSPVVGAVLGLESAIDQLAEVNLTALSDEDCVRLVDRLEVASRRLQSAGLPVLREVVVRRAYSKVGCSSPAAMLTALARLRPGAARARVEAMDALTPSVTPSGEVVDARFPNTAEALRAGVIGLDHAGVVARVMAKIPHKVDAEKRTNTEVALADLCRKHTPGQVEAIGERIVEYLDPDGTLADDTDRARKRGFSLGKPATDLMSTVAGHLDPVTRALLDVMLAVWAAPGMNNPDDPLSPSGAADDPTLDRDLLQAAADNDTRSAAQRNHDAVKSMLMYLLESGQLGKTHHGLPVQVIINMTKDQLDQYMREQVPPEGVDGEGFSRSEGEPGRASALAAGSDRESEPDPEAEPDREAMGVHPYPETHWEDPGWLPSLAGGPSRPYGTGLVYTATGAVLPIADALRLAVRSDKTLAIFENHSNEPLFLGRARRLASEAQRLAMFAAHRGCSHPGCSNPALWAEAHHVREWAQGGFTDITHLAPACPQHHQLVGPGEHQWQTVMITDGPDAGRCAWIPPALLDPERRPRVNRAHHPDEAIIEAGQAMLARRKAELEQRNRELGAPPPDPLPTRSSENNLPPEAPPPPCTSQNVDSSEIGGL
ncbi:HNH endonuclease [Williamsia muralis]|uniref:HNH endonuclease signature motif containing protein n=1 Tax=Williamsia marianensis TaxID=85044 RepID=UPI003F179F38